MALQQAGKSTGKSAIPPQPPKPQRISMNPDTFTAGGLINDVDITITDAQTTVWDMNGAVSPDTPFLAVEMTDANGTAHVQYYSAGKPEDWQPEESGEGFVSPSGKTGINGTTNLGMFLASLVEFGFPKENFDDGNLKVMIGTQAHVIQKVLERQGLIRTGKNASRPNQVLLVSKIHTLPGASGSGQGQITGKVAPKAAVAGNKASPSAGKTTGGKPNGQAATPPSGDDVLAQHIYTALQLHLGEAGEPIPVKAMPKVAFDYFKAEGLEGGNKAVALCNKQSFRASLADNGIVYDSDAGTVALAD
jgi:hypothetical protein